MKTSSKLIIGAYASSLTLAAVQIAQQTDLHVLKDYRSVSQSLYVEGQAPVQYQREECKYRSWSGTWSRIERHDHCPLFVITIGRPPQ